jgi:hypothetical protein
VAGLQEPRESPICTIMLRIRFMPWRVQYPTATPKAMALK